MDSSDNEDRTGDGGGRKPSDAPGAARGPESEISRRQDLDEMYVENDPHPLVRPGRYAARVIDWRDGEYRGHPKVYLDVQLTSELIGEPESGADPSERSPGGPEDSTSPAYEAPTGAILFRAYNIGRAAKRCTATQGSAYLREWSIAAGKKPLRLDRVGPGGFIGKRLLVDVRTVSKDGDGGSLDRTAHYSVVARIVDRIED